MSFFEQSLQSQLQARQQAQLYRRRLTLDGPQQPSLSIAGKNYLAFCSNDYLGLANHPALAEALTRGAQRWGVGSGASHLIVGHQQIHEQLEQALAEHVGMPRALLFSCGYMANMGAIKALVGPGDVIFHDELNHASLLDGGWLSRADCQRFSHANYDQLGRQLASPQYSRPQQKRLIISDSVFSMGGAIADVGRLSQLAGQHDAWLMIDDAHGLGVLGQHGSGISSQLPRPAEQIQVLVGTLGKAFGAFGAFVAGSQLVIETLIQRARSYIYTTALPAPVVAANLAALAIVRKEGWRRDKLQQLIAHFRAGAEALDLPIMDSNTPIQPLLYQSAEKSLAVSQALAAQGILVTAIRPPTVAEGSARLRVTLSTSHSLADVDQLLKALAGVPH